MRIEIVLNRTSKQRMLPMDYQYYISTWIYKVLEKADKDFSKFLHDKGYGDSETKLYKLFCFSRMNFGKPKLWKEQKLFEIAAHSMKLQISFDVHEIAANFIKGLFVDQEFFIGNKFNGIDFRVVTVSVLEEPIFQEVMHYRLQTPWVVSYKTEKARHAQYLMPDDEGFQSLAVKHIVEKFNHTRKEDRVSTDQIQLQINGKPKRSGFVIKPHTPQQTRVVGSLFDLQLSAPLEVHWMIWNAGISEKSSNGFGWLEEIKVYPLTEFESRIKTNKNNK